MHDDTFIAEYGKNVKALEGFLLPNVSLAADAGADLVKKLKRILKKTKASKVFVVSGIPAEKLSVREAFDGAGADLTFFTSFSPNPKLEEIELGVSEFEKSEAGLVIGLGGGSAIDTAKCIRHFSGKEVPLLAIPTTAGTGSDATKFAVYYKEGVKQSLESENVLPDYVLLCGDLIKTLPPYQRKCTFLDAFCQACESAFGRRRTEESLKLAFTVIEAMSFIKDFYPAGKGLGELDGELEKVSLPSVYNYALLCAYCSGRSINITRTAAPHAMSYKLSSMKNLPHGHAVAVCFGTVFERLAEAFVTEPSHDGSIKEVLQRISDLSFGVSPAEFSDKFRAFLRSIEINEPEVSKEEAEVLASSVNAQRLANNPLVFTQEELVPMYLKLGG